MHIYIFQQWWYSHANANTIFYICKKKNAEMHKCANNEYLFQQWYSNAFFTLRQKNAAETKNKKKVEERR